MFRKDTHIRKSIFAPRVKTGDNAPVYNISAKKVYVLNKDHGMQGSRHGDFTIAEKALPKSNRTNSVMKGNRHIGDNNDNESGKRSRSSHYEKGCCIDTNSTNSHRYHHINDKKQLDYWADGTEHFDDDSYRWCPPIPRLPGLPCRPRAPEKWRSEAQYSHSRDDNADFKVYGPSYVNECSCEYKSNETERRNPHRRRMARERRDIMYNNYSRTSAIDRGDEYDDKKRRFRIEGKMLDFDGGQLDIDIDINVWSRRGSFDSADSYY